MSNDNAFIDTRTMLLMGREDRTILQSTATQEASGSTLHYDVTQSWCAVLKIGGL